MAEQNENEPQAQAPAQPQPQARGADEGEQAQEGQAEERQAKKGGKLPVVLALVLLLAGGGFFAFKVKTKGTDKEAAIALGEIVQLDEFLVNLRGGSSYARTEIALHLREGFTKDDLGKALPAVRDAIVLRLSAKSLAEIQPVAGKIALKREIATVVNGVLEPKEEEKADGKAKEQKPPKPGWESDAGPVLKVYFTSFATQ